MPLLQEGRRQASRDESLQGKEVIDPDDENDFEDEIPFNDLIWLSPRHRIRF